MVYAVLFRRLAQKTSTKSEELNAKIRCFELRGLDGDRIKREQHDMLHIVNVPNFQVKDTV